jgi:hypothetical protein
MASEAGGTTKIAINVMLKQVDNLVGGIARDPAPHTGLLSVKQPPTARL